ncbi:uncharacterized protein F4807DRAFT_453276 [Annulohypoxylon truncatum]|uniref:uncharacterized protein n=1 Tax=Annulohypoxylon truncatum TaxID=327061 RepID=UPI0020088B4E|nr:uncharacterized protein F4807DRAFT_453276 [Annulohypoxylon truncatum]KAI1206730.1 hypothetical protein F4807DRAFT_453276 [Annulohypoxylon truncatum]
MIYIISPVGTIHLPRYIIAVHGLGPPNKDYESHAWDTWGTSSSTEGHLWLRYELPRYLPDSRIYLYAYDAATAYGKDRDTFASKASELLEAIQLERDDISSRPIIFLGHSLGGLLIQQALINAQETPKYTPIRAATSGLVFFATPRSDVHTLGGNRASRTVEELAAKLAIAAGFPDGDGVVEVLKEGSIFSDLTQEHWRRQLSGYDIISFWGTLDNMRQEDSIRLDLPDNHETLVMLTANHNDVCNFGPGQTDQANLELVAGKLQELYKKATGSKDPSTNDRLPYCYIPLPRNDVFTGRETVLNELNEWLDNHSKQHSDYEHSVHTLVGRSGVGKTQVALEFAYLVKDKHPECSIFWVTAQDPKASSKDFSKDWANIAELLCVWVDGTEKNPKQQVREYLESDAAGRWLLIVDDAVSCIGLPASEQGLTIITTTPSDIHHILQRDVEPQERITELGVMTPEEATTLFTALAGQPSIDEEMTMELLKELECLPLAIIQAAAYINQNQIQTAEYLGLLQATDQELADSMTWRFQRGHYMSGNSLARTLIVSLNQISKSDSVATSLLEFLSCIRPKAIPEFIFPDIQSERTEHAIRMLCGYAFLTKCENMYDMHDAVHRATCVWVEESGRRQDITTGALSHITAIGSIFLSNDTNNRKLQRECFPHALRVSEEIQISEDTYHLQCQLGSYLHASLRFDEAQRIMEKAYNIGRERDLPQDNIYQLRVEKVLATAFLKRRRTEEGIQMLEHLIAAAEKTPAYDDFNLPESKHQLAKAYMEFGRSEDAISLFEWVVNEHEMKIGDGLRLMSELYLAEAYFKVERNGEATKILERVQHLFKNMSAEEQRQVLELRYMHASSCLSKGRTGEALEILKHVRDVEQTLKEGKDRSVLKSDLARACVEEGRTIKHALNGFNYWLKRIGQNSTKTSKP